MTGPVPDVIGADLDVLFVGINPDPISGGCGHHFANPRNGFWRLLHEAGFTPRRLDPSEEANLLEMGIGLTNLVPRVARSSSKLTRDDFERGRRAFKRKLVRWRPRAVVFVGLTAWRALRAGEPASAGAEQPKLDDARVFVLPNPSGRNAGYTYAEMLRLWESAASELGRGHARRARTLQPREQGRRGPKRSRDRTVTPGCAPRRHSVRRPAPGRRGRPEMQQEGEE